jgi:sulfur carrier protein
MPGPTPGPQLAIVVNGDSRRVAGGTTVAGLLAELGLAGRQVAVERNREIVPRARHTEVELADGDRLELVTFVGGG